MRECAGAHADTDAGQAWWAQDGWARGGGETTLSDDGLLGASDVRRLAEQAGLHPRKSLGQNFLHDANTVRRIVRTAQLRTDDVVLEVGPGLGSLTLGLLPVSARVVAVEVDEALAAQLPRTVTERAPQYADRLAVVTADALRLSELPGPAQTALVANLPYNVAVPVLLHLLAVLPSLAHGLVMVQAEVADRLAAPPGSRIYGVPSVKAAWYADVRRAGGISRTVFWPAPRVDSGLVALTRREAPVGDRLATFACIDAAFAQRRKTLRAALAEWADGADAAEQALRIAGVDPRVRGEQLTVSDFARIATARTHADQ